MKGYLNMKKDFHFIIDRKTHKRLMKLSNQTKMSISSTVIHIFEKMTPYLEKKHIKFCENTGEYSLISPSDNNRKSIHVYLPVEYHRKLKLLHMDLNYYSMGKILREIIQEYLKGLFKSGLKLHVKKIENSLKNWKRTRSKFILQKKNKFIRHMSHKKHNPKIEVTYDSRYSPCTIRLLT